MALEGMLTREERSEGRGPDSVIKVGSKGSTERCCRSRQVNAENIPKSTISLILCCVGVAGLERANK